MPKKKARKKMRTVFVLDDDTWGLLSATVLSVVVMGLCFLRKVDGFEIAFRVALTFGGVYVATYLLFRAVLRPTFGPVIDPAKLARRLKAEAEAARALAAEESEAARIPEEPAGEE